MDRILSLPREVQKKPKIKDNSKYCYLHKLNNLTCGCTDKLYTNMFWYTVWYLRHKFRGTL